MERKVIDLRDCKEHVEIIAPENSKYSYDKDWTITITPSKDPFDLVPKSLMDIEDGNSICSLEMVGGYLRDLPSIKEDAEAFIALIQLRRLWHEWVKVLGKPIIHNDDNYNSFIQYDCSDKEWIFFDYPHTDGILIFKEKSHAEKFIECFKDLLEKAKELL